MKRRNGSKNARAKLRSRKAAVCFTRQCHEVFFEMGCRRELSTLRSTGKSCLMSQATGVRRLCCRVCGGLGSEQSPSALLLRTPFEGDLRLVVCLTEVESLVRQDNVVSLAKASEWRQTFKTHVLAFGLGSHVFGEVSSWISFRHFPLPFWSLSLPSSSPCSLSLSLCLSVCLSVCLSLSLSFVQFWNFNKNSPETWKNSNFVSIYV